MFREYGFDKVSVREIAAEVGVTTGTLYHHFKSKQDLFFAIGYQKADFMTELSKRFEKSEHPLEELEYFFSETMTQRILDDGYDFTQYRVLRSMRIGNRKGRLDHCVEILLQRAVELGKMPSDCPIEKAAEYLVWIYRGVAYRYSVSIEPIDLKSEMKKNIKIGILGLQNSHGVL